MHSRSDAQAPPRTGRLIGMAEIIPTRGRVYYADLGHGEKPWLVVSNNRRNQSLGDCVAVRITTSRKPQMPTIVELAASDPLAGRVLCDDLTQLFRDEITRDGGALSLPTMILVAAGLRAALAI
jgi:mRNA interferase MazF